MAETPSSFLRPFALTQGRTRSTSRDFPFETLVQASLEGQRLRTTLTPEHMLVIDLTPPPLSVAELAVHLRVHIGVARVILNDMAGQGLVEIAEPDYSDGGPDLASLERLLDDLKAF